MGGWGRKDIGSFREVFGRVLGQVLKEFAKKSLEAWYDFRASG
jgi:hypothetical protein